MRFTVQGSDFFWKNSNGRKIARIAPISTIFGSNKSSWRELFFEKKSKERNERKYLENFEKFSKHFGNSFTNHVTAASKIKICETVFWLGSGATSGRAWRRASGRTVVGGACVVSGAEKKAFDRGGPVWPPRSNAADDRLAGGLGGLCPPSPKSGGLGGSAPQPKLEVKWIFFEIFWKKSSKKNPFHL